MSGILTGGSRAASPARLVFLAMAALLAGCGDSTAPVNPKPGEPAPGPETSSRPPAGLQAVLPWKVSVRPSEASADATLTFTGTGFKPGRKCEVTVLYAKGASARKEPCLKETPAAVETDADGAFSLTGILLPLVDPSLREDGSLELWLEVVDLEDDTATTARTVFRYRP
ncbi:MAG: hypothetical protein HYY93_04655 [Planctomycetes bacterium]|nr:hypothetical protein [Planctomycetota bacterium]